MFAKNTIVMQSTVRISQVSDARLCLFVLQYCSLCILGGGALKKTTDNRYCSSMYAFLPQFSLSSLLATGD